MPHDEPGPPRIARPAEADAAESLTRDVAESSRSLLPQLSPGDILADRFVIEGLAGSGGMGTIHRATDRWTHEAVAIKVMASERVGHARRFAQEAAVLAELAHPSVVRYVAHGISSQSTQFLAMEWLAGEDLATRLARLPLTVEQSIVLLRHASAGVAAAHARGVVHRDIKPSNLFLVNGDPALLKVIDFGVARQTESTRTLTRPGAVLGTVGYMAPEQAMGLGEVDARADVFALGCVLFECLTGRAAFEGANVVAVLAKVLREDPPLVSSLRPAIGGALDHLVARLLAKDPAERPADAGAVLRALLDLDDAAEDAGVATQPALGLTAAEQKIVSVILGRPRHGLSRLGAPVKDDTRGIVELTLRFGAEPVALRGGGLLVVIADRGAASDQAGQAARCALLLNRARPGLRLAIATGCAETTDRIPVGAVIDRAAEMLYRSVRAETRRQATDHVFGAAPDAAAEWLGESEGAIAIDELTAGLLDPGLVVQLEGRQHVLIGDHGDPEAARHLMGKPTPFVGREKELQLLEATLRECIDESVAHAVLITGPPGQGKSRLRQEFVARARARGAVRILIARADPVGAGSAFLLARKLVRQAAGVTEGTSTAEQYENLRAYIADVCSGTDFARIADFLGELIGAPSSERPSPELRAARNDPQVMAVWLRRSFGDWLSAECEAAPLLLVLEDLHWGDLPSVTYLGEAQRALASKPLMVLALGRAEIRETFPNLGTGTEKQEIALGRLAPRAAERLVRQVLGRPIGPDALSSMLERADGNAFYLEELIRRAAAGESDGLPETVLALAQSRLERLEPEARRIVRAASIFGEALWRGGVAAVVGAAVGEAELQRWLRILVEREVLTLRHESRFASDIEYTFRHGLLREAAYAMLTAQDRSAGHHLAGVWLVQAGERDPLTLADHFELGGEPKQAVAWLLQAAAQAFDGGNLQASIALSERGIACGAEDVDRAKFVRTRASALLLRGDLVASIAANQEAMSLLPKGSHGWLLCAANLIGTAAYQGDQGISAQVADAILSAPTQPEPTGAYGWAVCMTCTGLTTIGALDRARSILERAEALEEGEGRDDLSFLAALRVTRGHLQLQSGELASGLASLVDAQSLSDRIVRVTDQASSRCLLVAAYAEVGCVERAEKSALELTSLCEHNGLHFLSDRSAAFLATAKLDAGCIPQAIALLRPLADGTDGHAVAAVRGRLAHVLVAAGDLDSAAHMANAALDACAAFPLIQRIALAALALVDLRRGQFSSALAHAQHGLEAFRVGWPRDHSILLLAQAEALHALGRREEARAVIREARARVLRTAASLDDRALRACYLTHIEANARTLELASEWLERDS
jgi:eukaryotic-like serine/threonine-protein kinase